MRFVTLQLENKMPEPSATACERQSLPSCILLCFCFPPRSSQNEKKNITDLVHLPESIFQFYRVQKSLLHRQSIICRDHPVQLHTVNIKSPYMQLVIGSTFNLSLIHRQILNIQNTLTFPTHRLTQHTQSRIIQASVFKLQLKVKAATKR